MAGHEIATNVANKIAPAGHQVRVARDASGHQVDQLKRGDRQLGSVLHLDSGKYKARAGDTPLGEHSNRQAAFGAIVSHHASVDKLATKRDNGGMTTTAAHADPFSDEAMHGHGYAAGADDAKRGAPKSVNPAEDGPAYTKGYHAGYASAGATKTHSVRAYRDQGGTYKAEVTRLDPNGGKGTPLPDIRGHKSEADALKVATRRRRRRQTPGHQSRPRHRSSPVSAASTLTP